MACRREKSQRLGLEVRLGPPMHKGDIITQFEVRTLKAVFVLVGRSEGHGFFKLACLDELLDASLEIIHFRVGGLLVFVLSLLHSTLI